MSVVKSISLDRIVSIEAKKHDLAEAMAAPNLAPEDFVRLSRRSNRWPPPLEKCAGYVPSWRC